MKVRSVNVGQPRENPWKAMKLTGIDKRPVAGPVMSGRPGPLAQAGCCPGCSSPTRWTGSSRR